jgi:hypothetical protein
MEIDGDGWGLTEVDKDFMHSCIVILKQNHFPNVILAVIRLNSLKRITHVFGKTGDSNNQPIDN